MSFDPETIGELPETVPVLSAGGRVIAVAARAIAAEYFRAALFAIV
jgi:hypothetical protein